MKSSSSSHHESIIVMMYCVASGSALKTRAVDNLISSDATTTVWTVNEGAEESPKKALRKPSGSPQEALRKPSSGIP